MRRQPHVDALHVVQVFAQGQPPHHLAALHRAEAHGALRPVAVAPAPRRLSVRVLRKLGDVYADMVAFWPWIALCSGGGDWSSSAEQLVVAVEEEDGEERCAREADPGVAEDQRTCAAGRWAVLRFWDSRCGFERSSHAGGAAAATRCRHSVVFELTLSPDGDMMYGQGDEYELVAGALS